MRKPRPQQAKDHWAQLTLGLGSSGPNRISASRNCVGEQVFAHMCGSALCPAERAPFNERGNPRAGGQS